MAVNTNRLVNANVYLDGVSLLGMAEECDLPVIKWKQSEQKGLGLVGTIELPTGIEKLETKIKWNSFYADAMVKMANPTQTVNIQLRGNLETWTPDGLQDEVPYVVFLKVLSKDFPTGNIKQHDNAEFESMLNTLYVRQEVNGREIVEYDPLANIYKVDGVDMLLNFRNNLGI